MDPEQLDIATAVLRIEQIGQLPEGDTLRENLITRLVECDAPRLRQYLAADTLDTMDQVIA